jgi:hypothetical protein
MKTSFIVAENFYTNPLSVRKQAFAYLTQETVDPDPRLEPSFNVHCREKFARLVGKPLTGYGSPNSLFDFGMGSMFDLAHYGLHRSKYRNIIDIHDDQGAFEYIGLVYLTPDAPSDAGTSFWRHKATELSAYPSPSDAKRLGTSVAKLREELQGDSHRRNRWEETGYVGNVFNRVVVFRAGRFHSAQKIFGRNKETGRLTHVFNFSTI